MFFIYTLFLFNPLNANLVNYVRHGSNVVCSGCSASYGQIHEKWTQCFERRENLLQNSIPHFMFKFSQLSEIAL